jgi:agmatinase
LTATVVATSAPDRPFLDWPIVTDPGRWSGRATIIGVPYGEPYAGEPVPNDQAAAPAAIRAQSRQFCDGPEQWDFDLGAPLGRRVGSHCFDGGDCAHPKGDFAAYFADTVARLMLLLRRTRFVAVLGGDHGATIPVLHALEAVGRPVHVVQIDAHLDWRHEVGGVRLGCSSPMRRASELPCVCGITQIGLRGTGSARTEEVDAALAYGARLFTAQAVHRDGLDPVLAHLAGKGPYYLTIDADGLDPAAMPGVMAPGPVAYAPTRSCR